MGKGPTRPPLGNVGLPRNVQSTAPEAPRAIVEPSRGGRPHHPAEDIRSHDRFHLSDVVIGTETHDLHEHPITRMSIGSDRLPPQVTARHVLDDMPDIR
jgi:hypothetical protein